MKIVKKRDFGMGQSRKDKLKIGQKRNKTKEGGGLKILMLL